MQTPHILIVEDELVTRNTLKSIFEAEGYIVHEANDGAEMHNILSENDINLVIMDINLPGKNGLLLARELREQASVALMFLTGRDNEVDKILGLEIGADDYITKPFNLREVLARVRAVLRRYHPEDRAPGAITGERKDERYSFDGFTLSIQRRELADASGRVIELTTAEFNLLELLVTRPSRVMTRDNIMDALKGHEWSPFDRSIDTLVARLRKKIEGDTEHPRLIKTVRGVGYVFTADVGKS